MNTPNPIPPSGGLSNGTQNAIGAGTVSAGAVIGSVVGRIASAALGPEGVALEPVITTVCTALFTAAFHWLGQKLGVPGLG